MGKSGIGLIWYRAVLVTSWPFSLMIST
jgi:hypothetical protein